jgi:hypothetical protein
MFRYIAHYSQLDRLRRDYLQFLFEVLKICSLPKGADGGGGGGGARLRVILGGQNQKIKNLKAPREIR